MGVLTPYSQWIKSIQYDIMELFQNYRNVFIHQAKLAFLCTQLKTFYSDITSRKFPEVAPSPNDANVLRNLVASLKAMIEFFQTLDQSHSLDTILKNEIDAVANYLVNFQENFNKSVVSLKIVNENVFVDDQAQFMTDDFADNKKILETIQTYVTSGIALQPEILKMFELKREKINELLKSYEEKLNQMNGENVRILSQEEVFQRTQNLKKWQVDQNDFELQKKIGAGGFADVYIGIQKSTKKVVAIKILHNEEFNEQTFNLFLREVEIFGTIQHFAVLPFIGVCLTPPYYIITEYMPGGCLFNRIHSNKARLDGTKRTIIALGIAYAMEYIHRLDFLHRDLKSLNILLDADDYPKVCDFGMSRLLPNNPDELMTGCAGTLQWMAPEVLNYEKYGKKSDVYSYGILLWEILTNNIPFRGFKDVQIAMAVVNNHTRPIMPHDQAGVLGKFIKLCWDQDPNKRPTFEKIIVAFESGQLFYPGANMAIVNAYRNQFNPKQEKIEKPLAIQQEHQLMQQQLQEQALSASLDILNKLTDIEQASTSLQFIIKNLTNQKVLSQLVQTGKLITSLLETCSICNSANMATEIIIVFTGLSRYQNLVTEECVRNVMEIFMKFGTTQTKEILSFIHTAQALISKIKLNQRYLGKIGTFLQSSTITLRVEASNLIYHIVNNHFYDNVYSLKTIVPYVIANCTEESPNELLTPSLIISCLLLKMPELYENLMEQDIFLKVASVFTAKKPDQVYAVALQSFALIMKNIKITEENIRQSIPLLPKINTVLPHNILPRFIALYCHIVQYKKFYEFVEKNKEIVVINLGSVLRSNSTQTVLLGMKLCYSLINYKGTHNSLQNLTPIFISLVKSRIHQIASIAAACLVILSEETIDSLLNDDVISFFNVAFSSENVLTVNGLRLCGSIVNTVNGSKYLQDKGVITKIATFIGSKNFVIQKLALMVYAAFSSSIPISSACMEVLPTFIQAMKFQALQPYPLIFLSNVTINPKCATACAQQLNIFGPLFQSNEKVILNEAIETLLKIVSCPESIQAITDSEALTKIVTAAAEHSNDEIMFGKYLELISTLSGIGAGKNALLGSSIYQTLIQKESKLTKGDPQKTLIMRIFARCSC